MYQWIPEDGLVSNMKLAFFGKVFDLAEFGKSLDRAEIYCKTLLEKLSLGYMFKGFQPQEIHDDIRETKPGYYFLFHQLNSGLLAESRKYYTSIEKSMVPVEWKKLERRLLETLLYIYHCSSGQPARKTELASLMICNDASNSRSIYLYHPSWMVVQTYHKQGNHQPIARFIPQRYFNLFLWYFMYIYPCKM
jgi:hypothetical protein